MASKSNGGTFQEVAVTLCSISAAIAARSTDDDLDYWQISIFVCYLAESDVWPKGEIVSNSCQLAIVLLDNARLVFT